MSLPINYQNIKIPFPPTIDVGVIVQEHLKNGIRNANQTGNAFMIYLRNFRKEYSNIITMFNLPMTNVSRFASSSWIREPPFVKKFYKQKAIEVKKCFKKNVPFHFINKFGKSNRVRKNGISLEKDPTTNTIYPPQHLNIDQNSSCNGNSNYQDSGYPDPQLENTDNTIYPNPQHLNIDPNSLSVTYSNYQYSTYPNPQLENTDSNPPDTIYPSPLYPQLENTNSNSSNTIYPPQHLNIGQNSLCITCSNYQDSIYSDPQFENSPNTIYFPQHLNITYSNYQDSTYSDPNSSNNICPSPQHSNIDQNSSYITYSNYQDSGYSDSQLKNTDSIPPNTIYFPQHMNIDQNSLYITYSNYQDSAYHNFQLENTNSNPNIIYSNSSNTIYSEFNI
ncbi:hypothetical protein Glove_344g39 [Diversispora epigaea]|uniref:HMG box domain-containing protein n=1 Tax=Diversispora epigaea TaxID=1348612 RepID=A0A397HNK8_9GLOM|nr:hypothetical protein Glove_344g39 [Diversispora epigaea]